MVNLTILVEGGGKVSQSACRRGFASFVEKAGLQGEMPKFVSCGSRYKAYSTFKKMSMSPDIILLVDAEEAVTTDQPWNHLSKQDSWQRPKGATNEQCHLMVQVMESWFLADKETLAKYYGQGFNTKALPKNTRIENIPKRDVEEGLKNATKNTQKGKYNKKSHSFEILALLDPDKVRKASPYADRFIKTLLGESDG